MSGLFISVALGHLPPEDRDDARLMLSLIGLRRYGQLSQSRVIDMLTLKQIYAKAMNNMLEEESPSEYRGEEESKERGSEGTGQVKEEGLGAETRGAAEMKPSAFRLNAPRVSRPDVLDHFPFKDDGEMAGLLEQPPGPAFLTLGLPLRKRLAAKVYAECAAGSVGMKVSDIPKGLVALGLSLDEALAKGFQGTFSTQSLSLGQWQGVVKRFAAREEAAASAKVTASVMRPYPTRFLQHQTFPVYNQPRMKSAPAIHPSMAAPVSGVAASYSYSNFSSHGSKENFDVNVGGLPGIGDGKRQPSAVGIADTFLKGSLGRLVASRPDGWWDEVGCRTDGGHETEHEDDPIESEAHDQAVLQALGLLPKSSKLMTLPTTDLPSVVSGPLNQSTLSLQQASERLEQESTTGASSSSKKKPDEGWRRSKGGLVADFGPPHIFRKSQTAIPLSENEKAAAVKGGHGVIRATAQAVPPHLMELLRPKNTARRQSVRRKSHQSAKPLTPDVPPVSSEWREAWELAAGDGASHHTHQELHQELPAGGGARKLSLAEHRRARMKSLDRGKLTEDSESSEANSTAFNRITKAIRHMSTKNTNSSSTGGMESATSSGPNTAAKGQSEIFLDPAGILYVGRSGSDAGLVSETDSESFVSGLDGKEGVEEGAEKVKRVDLSQSVAYYDAANVSVDSSSSEREVDLSFGYDAVYENRRRMSSGEYRESEFEFSAEDTTFLGAGAAP